MRLINVQTQLLEDFTLREIPRYAILSHRWTDEEVTFQEFLNQDELTARKKTRKKGFLKILDTCQLAARDGISYVWVDTCCIDKSSSAELSEAINSMWRYYKDAEACYAYLFDLKVGANFAEDLSSCGWFTRGWTLQELIAPKNLRFYNERWQFQGTKDQFADLIHHITNIPSDILRNPDRVTKLSIAVRMTWASKRETTRIEDTAYCLLGIFDINMPLLYGEGNKAFIRLQEEIIKNNNDLSLFGWCPEDAEEPIVIPRMFEHTAEACNADCGHQRSDEYDFYSVLAPSPKAFAKSRCWDVMQSVEHSVLNRGIKINCTLLQVCLRGCQYAYCGCCSNCRKYVLAIDRAHGIILRKTGPNTFIRSRKQLIGLHYYTTFWQANSEPFYLLTKAPFTSQDTLDTVSLDINQSSGGVIGVSDAMPESNWDFVKRRWQGQDYIEWGIVRLWLEDEGSSFYVVFESFGMEVSILDGNLYTKEILLVSQNSSTLEPGDVWSILGITSCLKAEKDFCVEGRVVRVKAGLELGQHSRSLVVRIEGNISRSHVQLVLY
jgi:hypothetical protein